MNPARDATLPSARRSRIHPPSPAKVRALMKSAEEHSPEMGLFIRLAALLGARRGEVCGLQWEDFDEPAGTIQLRRGVVEVRGSLLVKDTKTHAERAIALDLRRGTSHPVTSRSRRSSTPESSSTSRIASSRDRPGTPGVSIIKLRRRLSSSYEDLVSV